MKSESNTRKSNEQGFYSVFFEHIIDVIRNPQPTMSKGLYDEFKIQNLPFTTLLYPHNTTFFFENKYIRRLTRQYIFYR